MSRVRLVVFIIMTAAVAACSITTTEPQRARHALITRAAFDSTPADSDSTGISGFTIPDGHR